MSIILILWRATSACATPATDRMGALAPSKVYLVSKARNLSNPDTNGAEESVVVSEVSSFQRLKCMQEWYYLGWEKVSCFERCPPHFRGVLIEGFGSLIMHLNHTSLRVINLSLSFSPPSSLHSSCPRHLGVHHSLCCSHHSPADFRLFPATQVPQKQVSIDDCHSNTRDRFMLHLPRNSLALPLYNLT